MRITDLGKRGALQILFEMRNRFHSNERRGEGKRLRECYSAAGITVESGEGGTQLVRESPGTLGLHEGGPAAHPHVESVRRLQERDAVSADKLSGDAHGFRH